MKKWFLWAWFTDILQRLDAIDAKLASLQKGQTKMEATLADLQKAVTDERTVEQGAVVLLQKLTALIGAAKNDPAAIQAILDDVNAQKADLAAAITANTPAEPTT